MNNTIYALSSAKGKSGISVIRISGDNLSYLFGKISKKNDPKPRFAYFIKLVDLENQLIDECICIYFKSPHSSTGEEIIEIHPHGSKAVIDKIFKLLDNLGLRLAEPGEFTKRAFYNNKMNLIEVDGLINILDAKTDKQHKLAISNLTGKNTDTILGWRNEMLEICAYSAAISDYPSDELPDNIEENIKNKSSCLYTNINKVVSNFENVNKIQNGINISIIGETNVGKSSIFNKIIGESRAIISDIPGTTRDVISIDIDINGYLVHLSDTAGIRETTDIVENIGISKTYEEIEKSDIVLKVVTPAEDIEKINLDNKTILIVNKSDLIKEKKKNSKNIIYLSALNNTGFDILIKSITNKIEENIDSQENFVVITKRVKDLLIDALNWLKISISKPNIDFDILSEQIKYASNSIGKAIGIITVDETLDLMFSTLCLGK